MKLWQTVGAMFSPNLGVSKDLTSEFLSIRDSGDNGSMGRNDFSDTSALLQREIPKESPLDPFFQLRKGILNDISRAKNLFKSLTKAQKECLRPTFANASDQIAEVNNLNQQINEILQSINARIQYFKKPRPENDREMILNNIFISLNENYKEFNFQFKTSQQTFSATYYSAPHVRSQESQSAVDFSTFNPGDESSQRAMEIQQRQNNAEFEALSRRAEEIKQLFVDLANLITEQGTVIQRIDYNITQTLDNARTAHDEVVEAEKYQKKSRMWICAAILGIMIVLMLIMAFLK